MESINNWHKSLETISVLALASIVFGLILKIQILYYLALCFLIIGVFFKGLSMVVANVWLKFAHVLGFINTRIILTMIFYLFLTPIALTYRFFHGDFMNIKRNSVCTSYFTERDHEYEPKDFENVW